MVALTKSDPYYGDLVTALEPVRTVVMNSLGLAPIPDSNLMNKKLYGDDERGLKKHPKYDWPPEFDRTHIEKVYFWGLKVAGKYL